MAIDITDKDCKQEVLEASEKLVVVDFWADWCMPCKMLSPILDDLEEELDNGVKFFKLNVEENKKTASEYEVMSIPAVVMFQDGKEVERIVGLRQKNDYISNIKKYLQE
jgi:thioredoxin 1